MMLSAIFKYFDRLLNNYRIKVISVMYLILLFPENISDKIECFCSELKSKIKLSPPSVCGRCLFSSVQLLSRVQLFATPWTAAHQACLSIGNSQSLLKLMSIESVMPSDHFTLCCLLLLLPSIFTSIRVFSNESALCIRWPKYWSFSFSISPSNEYSGLISHIQGAVAARAQEGLEELSQVEGQEGRQ